jgi:hypothetical protein
MNPALEAVINKLNTITNACVYYDKNQILSEQTTFVIESAIEGTDPIYGDYVEYKLELNEEIGLLITDRNINIATKYIACLNNTYENVQIVLHTTDGFSDTVRCTNVPNVAKPLGADEATILSLKLTDSIYLSSSPIDIPNFTPPKMCLFSGEEITILISTKDDQQRERLNSYQHEIMSIIMKGYRKFDIMVSGVKRGYYKLIDIPRISTITDNGWDVQQSTIVLKGYYLVSY